MDYNTSGFVDKGEAMKVLRTQISRNVAQPSENVSGNFRTAETPSSSSIVVETGTGESHRQRSVAVTSRTTTVVENQINSNTRPVDQANKVAKSRETLEKFSSNFNGSSVKGSVRRSPIRTDRNLLKDPNSQK